MLIEDEELRGIFQEASEDGLRKIKAGLAELRENPKDAETLEDLLRESHSLKGNAGMLGLKDIATLTQQWEHLLSQVKGGQVNFDDEVQQRLDEGLTALDGLVREAITGEPSGVQTFYILAKLMGSQESTVSSHGDEAQSSSSAPAENRTTQPRSLVSRGAETPERSPGRPPETSADALEADDILGRLEAEFLALEDHDSDEAAQETIQQSDRIESLFRDLDRLEQLTGDDGQLQTLTQNWKQDLVTLIESGGSFEAQADHLYDGLDAIRAHFHPRLSPPPLSEAAPPSPSPAPQGTASQETATYIEDDELRHTFQQASQDHLQKLYDGLLHLEQFPDDRAKLEDILREVHSLKGDAGMLGVTAVAQLAHDWEQELAPVKSGQVSIDNEKCDRLLMGLDRIRRLIHQAITPPEQSESESEEDNAAPPVAESRYIEDDELRQTFQVASEDHLQKLDAGLLYLEEHPQDESKLDEVLREIHSIKGDAAMLGISDMAQLAHEWEQQLLPVKQGRETFDSSLCDRLGDGIKDLRRLVDEAISNSPAQLSLMESLARLRGETGQPAPTPARAKPSETSSNSSGADHHDGNYRIDTIRVDTQNLDALMTTAGELTVTKIRIAHRLSEIEEVVAFWEEWAREAGNTPLKLNQPFQNELQKTIEQRGGGTRGTNGHVSRMGAAAQAPISEGALLNFYRLQEQNEARLETLGKLVNRLQVGIAEDTARLETLADEIEEGVRTLRLLPLSTIFNLYPRLVRDLARSQGKEVRLKIIGGDTRADKRILEDMKDPLTHIIRNAIDHGIESPEERQRQGKPSTATITLRGYQTASTIAIEVSDDGQGLDLKKIKKTAIKNEVASAMELDTMTPNQIQNLIFMPGFSTRNFVTEVSGRGVGLDVVRANVERLKGSVQVKSNRGQGCSIHLQLGTTLATAHVLLLEVRHIYHEATRTILPRQAYALPVEFVQTALMIAPDDIFSLEGRETILHDNQPISVVHLADILELPIRAQMEDKQSSFACILLKVGEDWLGLLVDRLIDEQDAILKPQSKLLKRVRNVSGATILGTGEVCMVLNPVDIIKSVRGVHRRANVSSEIIEPASSQAETPAKQMLLLVEDSITTRTQEKRILEAAGYGVVTAVDGLDGYNKLRSGRFDAVVSDIQMPNLDGLELTARIRNHQEYSELPIVLVTSLATDEDRRRGADAGANAYITKSSFNQDVLVETLQRLI
ncbi:MAG: hybrid sensor histidine kinase/response regulator [Phormidium sp. SL48-SHIP]|nr:MAG: hybrid sensor histidine kinase/response regulator [Phormidium sp. SL48-SHIP]